MRCFGARLLPCPLTRSSRLSLATFESCLRTPATQLEGKAPA
jgi:hypothetical protein